MTSLNIDIETFSDVSIKDAGVYKYTESPAFEIMLFSYSVDGGPVVNVDLTIDYLPDWLIAAILDPNVEKFAYNAAFERRCLSVYLKRDLRPEMFTCTMVKAAMVGLPFGLDNVCKALKLEQGKLSEGKALLRYFASPCKPTKTNGGRTRNLPHHAPDKWARLVEYNVNDVVLEMAVGKKIEFFEIPETEKKLWCLDQRINDRGVKLDLQLVQQAISLDIDNTCKLEQEVKDITNIDNPNSGPQLKNWLNDNTIMDCSTLTKESVKVLLEDVETGSTVERVLQIRQELTKTSNKKWPAMLDCVGADNRVRGILQFYGAGRTGRWAGRLIQPQNLPGIKLDDVSLDIARQLVLKGDSDGIQLMYGNIPDTLSQLIRTAIIPADGHRFIICDLSQIEARIIAWLSGERWRLDVFATHGKIYEASAAAMFKVDIDQVTKTSTYRQKAKIAELALGYQGGIEALKTMGAVQMGVPEDDLQDLVYAWRAANKRIVQYWYDINKAAIEAVRDRVPVKTAKGVTFKVEKGVLFVILPNGRRLSYLRPQIGPGRFGGDQVSYEGLNQINKQWCRTDTYGGKFVENIVQAIARDILAEGMLCLDRVGYKIVLSVHDEVVLEMPEGVGSFDRVEELMTVVPDWAKGLPLGAEGFESSYYKK